MEVSPKDAHPTPPPEPRDACFIMDECTLFDYLDYWKKTPTHASIKLGRARILKKNITQIHLESLEGE